MVLVSYEDVEESYEEIKQAACGRQACSVLIMVAYEIDAMASSRIFTQLLRRDNVAYTIRPVINFAELEKTFNSITSDIKSIVLFNCGGVTNIDKTFNLCFGGDVRCYIFDNHRPIHLANIYSTYNVVVFMDPSEMEKTMPSDNSDVSSFDEAASDSDEEASDSTEGDGEFEQGDEPDEEEQAQAEHVKSQLEEEEEVDGDNSDESAKNEEDEGNDEDEDAAVSADDEDEGEDVDKSDSDSEEHDDDAASVSNEEKSDAEEGTRDDDEEAEKKDDDVDEEEEDIRVVGKKRKRSEAERLARDRKDRVERYYKGNALHATPTSMMLVVLVIGRCGSNIPIDLLWQAILGVTDQYFRDNLSETIYNDCCEKLRFQLGDHIESSSDRVRYSVAADETVSANNNEGGGVVSVPGSENGHIQDGHEFRFFLHRHWSLLESMSHSAYIAAKLSVYSTKESKLNEMLAKMGIPLSECKQSFQFMAPELRNHFFQQIVSDAIIGSYGLINPAVTFKSFYRYNSFKNSISAADVVIASSILLDSYKRRNVEDASSAEISEAAVGAVDDGAVTSTSMGSDAFYEAYSCLSRFSDDVLKKGINNALLIQKMLVKKAMVLVDSRESITKYNRFYAAFIRRASGIDSKVASEFEHSDLQFPFERPSVLARLGQFIMNVKMSIPKKDGGWTGSVLLPLILVSELHDGNFLVMGVSPLSCLTGNEQVVAEEHLDKLLVLTNFRMFFKQAAKDIKIDDKVANCCFDTNSIIVHKNDVQDFIGTLDYCLKKATPVLHHAPNITPDYRDNQQLMTWLIQNVLGNKSIFKSFV